MLWTIVKREITANILSFRFLMGLLIYFSLIVTNLFVLTRGYEDRLQSYQTAVRENELWNEFGDKAGDYLKKRQVDLPWEPADPRGLGVLESRTAYGSGETVSLRYFRNEDGVPFVQGYYGFKENLGNAESGGNWRAPNFHYSSANNWSLEYPQDIFRKNDALSNFTELDWTFIIGLVMSFMALLFTYDAISGERETGPLSLLMSNSMSRATVLLAKFIGAFLTVMLPLLIGILLNLMIVNASELVSLDGNEWIRVGIIFVISAIYISIFLWIGLFISSQFSNSSSSLLVLLLIWVVFIVLIPNTMGVLASSFQQVPSRSEVSRLKQAKLDEIDDRYFDKDRRLFQFSSPSDNPPKIEALQVWAGYL